MAFIFKNEAHEAEFKRCLAKDNTYPGDAERYSLFYILAGNSELASRGIDTFYNFKEHMIKSSSVKGCFSSSARTLIKLAFNLYNSLHKSETVSNTFYNLDDGNMTLAMNAIMIRFKRPCMQY
jgi:hypothetical protein